MNGRQRKMSEDTIRAMLDVGRSLHAQLEQVIDDYLRVYGYDVTAMALRQQSERLARIYASELTEAPRDHDGTERAPSTMDYLAARFSSDRRADRADDEQVT
jgi:hypothetical protein